MDVHLMAGRLNACRSKISAAHGREALHASLSPVCQPLAKRHRQDAASTAAATFTFTPPIAAPAPAPDACETPRDQIIVAAEDLSPLRTPPGFHLRCRACSGILRAQQLPDGTAAVCCTLCSAYSAAQRLSPFTAGKAARQAQALASLEAPVAPLPAAPPTVTEAAAAAPTVCAGCGAADAVRPRDGVDTCTLCGHVAGLSTIISEAPELRAGAEEAASPTPARDGGGARRALLFAPPERSGAVPGLRADFRGRGEQRAAAAAAPSAPKTQAQDMARIRAVMLGETNDREALMHCTQPEAETVARMYVAVRKAGHTAAGKRDVLLATLCLAACSSRPVINRLLPDTVALAFDVHPDDMHRELALVRRRLGSHELFQSAMSTDLLDGLSKRILQIRSVPDALCPHDQDALALEVQRRGGDLWRPVHNLARLLCEVVMETGADDGCRTDAVAAAACVMAWKVLLPHRGGRKSMRDRIVEAVQLTDANYDRYVKVVYGAWSTVHRKYLAAGQTESAAQALRRKAADVWARSLNAQLRARGRIA